MLETLMWSLGVTGGLTGRYSPVTAPFQRQAVHAWSLRMLPQPLHMAVPSSSVGWAGTLGLSPLVRSFSLACLAGPSFSQLCCMGEASGALVCVAGSVGVQSFLFFFLCCFHVVSQLWVESRGVGSRLCLAQGTSGVPWPQPAAGPGACL